MSLEVSSSPTQLVNQNKRLSKVPLGVVAFIVILVLFAIVYAAIVRKQSIERKDTVATEERKNNVPKNANKDTANFIDSLSQVSPLESSVAPQMKQETIAPMMKPSQAPLPPLPVPSQDDKKMSREEEKELQMKREMRMKALIAGSRISKDKEQRESNSKSNQEDNNISEKLLFATKNMSEREATEFLKRTTNKAYLQQQKEKAISKYEIKAGWVIPAILITGINSDLPGSILAQVSQNVYDTATGRYLLIPQGTKLVGEYKSNVLYGQERVLTAWTRLIFPNGDSLNLENMSGTSPDGYSGFTDQVNNHYLRIFGSAFLLSSISAGIAMSDNSSGEKETNADKAMSQAIDKISDVASEMMRKNMNISPTLEIRPGYKFNIFVTKDIILEPLNIERGE